MGILYEGKTNAEDRTAGLKYGKFFKVYIIMVSLYCTFFDSLNENQIILVDRVIRKSIKTYLGHIFVSYAQVLSES
jgi:hypothetical protein